VGKQHDRYFNSKGTQIRNGYPYYEILSSPVATKPVKRTQPPTTPLANAALVKVVLVHGIPCSRPMAEITHYTGKAGIIGLLAGNQRLEKTTRVFLFGEKVNLRERVRMRGHWLPVQAYNFDRRNRDVERCNW